MIPDHSRRTTRYLIKGLCPCLCKYCDELPYEDEEFDPDMIMCDCSCHNPDVNILHCMPCCPRTYEKRTSPLDKSKPTL